jgi:hypothetical protein
MNTPARPYICTIPEAPPSFNDYNGWPDWKQREKKRQWQSMVLGLVNQKGNKAPRRLECVTLKAVISFVVNRGRDADNYTMPLWKWTQDALVLAGVLVDDTHDRCFAGRPHEARAQRKCSDAGKT